MEINDTVSVINPENNKHVYDGTIISRTCITIRVRPSVTEDDNQAELWPVEWVKPFPSGNGGLSISANSIEMPSNPKGYGPSPFSMVETMIQATELALRAQLRVSALKRVSNSVKQQVNNVASACLDAVKMIATVEDARACGCQQVAERLPLK